MPVRNCGGTRSNRSGQSSLKRCVGVPRFGSHDDAKASLSLLNTFNFARYVVFQALIQIKQVLSCDAGYREKTSFFVAKADLDWWELGYLVAVTDR